MESRKFLLAYGVPYGRIEIQNVLRTATVLFRRLKSYAASFSFYGFVRMAFSIAFVLMIYKKKISVFLKNSEDIYEIS